MTDGHLIAYESYLLMKKYLPLACENENMKYVLNSETKQYEFQISQQLYQLCLRIVQNATYAMYSGFLGSGLNATPTKWLVHNTYFPSLNFILNNINPLHSAKTYSTFGFLSELIFPGALSDAYMEKCRNVIKNNNYPASIENSQDTLLYCESLEYLGLIAITKGNLETADQIWAEYFDSIEEIGQTKTEHYRYNWHIYAQFVLSVVGKFKYILEGIVQELERTTAMEKISEAVLEGQNIHVHLKALRGEIEYAKKIKNEYDTFSLFNNKVRNFDLSSIAEMICRITRVKGLVD